MNIAQYDSPAPSPSGEVRTHILEMMGALHDLALRCDTFKPAPRRALALCENPATVAGPPTPEDVRAYIAEMTASLREMALQHGYQDISATLSVAQSRQKQRSW